MKTISLVIVDNKNHELARFSIEKTLQQIECKNVITFSNKQIIEGAKFVPIKGDIDFYDYSEILLKHLWLYVETDYALVIQWDGMAANKELWTSDFLNYDYIGAPWNNTINGFQVGNGGFSLRSKKLIHALRDTTVNIGTHLSGQNEDIAISVEYRNFLSKKYNINYGPIEVARKFSTENNWLGNTFGFHGLWNIPKFLTKKEIEYIIERIPSYFLKDNSKKQNLINKLNENNYKELALLLQQKN